MQFIIVVMKLRDLNDFPKEVKTNNWRMRKFTIDKNRLERQKGVYIISLNFTKYQDSSKSPNLFEGGKFFPLYVGEGYIKDRLGKHQSRDDFADVKESCDFWFHPLLLSDKRIGEIESVLIELLRPLVNKKRQEKQALQYFNNTTLSSENSVEKRIESEDIKIFAKKKESINLEFKETFAFNTRTADNKKDEVLIKECLKTIASFGNSFGGNLIIGIKENKLPEENELVGVERDLKSFYHNDIDRMKGAIKDTLKTNLGIHNLNLFRIKEVNINNRYFFHINVKKSFQKIFINEEEFWQRNDHGEDRIPTAKIDEAWKSRNKLINK